MPVHLNHLSIHAQSAGATMVHRLAFITVVGAVLCVIGIPMSISYELACKRLGSNCGAQSVKNAWHPLQAVTAPAVAESF